jgi:hypothetical protein
MSISSGNGIPEEIPEYIYYTGNHKALRHQGWKNCQLCGSSSSGIDCTSEIFSHLYKILDIPSSKTFMSLAFDLMI